MGLDAVELVMAIEEEFGITFTEREAERITTVGKTYRCLEEKLKTTTTRQCLSQAMFYKLRRALIETYALRRKQITPETVLSNLIPYEEVKDGWPYLELCLKLDTPNFDDSKEIFGIRFDEKTLLIRQIVEALIDLNYDALLKELQWDADIWDRLVRVIIAQLNVNPEEIRFEASYTRDLGVD